MRNHMMDGYLGIHRTCGCCGEIFYINKDNVDDAIYYDKKTYHSSCFIKICKERSEMKRKNVSTKWKWVLDNIDSIKEKSRSHLIREIDKDMVFCFIKSNYDITIIPTTIWQKIWNIYAGTYLGMTSGIPPEHLLDMWDRKIDLLNSIASKNAVRGKTMDTQLRISYDLSVLVNKYDSYLKWLEKQKILEAEKEINKTQNIVGDSIGYTKQKIESKENDDISCLVDDIFD